MNGRFAVAQPLHRVEPEGGPEAPATSIRVRADEPLSPDGLARRAGTTVAFIDQMADLGIIARAPTGGFMHADVQRVRLALALDGSGVSLEDFGRGVAAGKLSLEFAGHLLDEPRGLLKTTQRELLAQLGLSPEWSDRLAVLIGLAPDPGDRCIHEDDAELIRILAAMLAAGFSEERMTRALQVFGDAMRRISSVESELWREDFVRPALEAGLSHQEMLDRTTEAGPEVERLAHRLIPLLHRRYLDTHIFRNTVEWLEAAMEEAGVRRRPTMTDQAIAFLDLAGYTRLTEEHGDELAADQALALIDVVRTAAIAYGGRPVKFLGDGVMLHFREPPNAVRCGLDLVDRAAEVGLPPARAGINAGPLIERDGDFFGSTVNIAARIADYARPREVLTAQAAASLCDEPDLAFAELGPASLKGVKDPIQLFVASRVGGDPDGIA